MSLANPCLWITPNASVASTTPATLDDPGQPFYDPSKTPPEHPPANQGDIGLDFPAPRLDHGDRSGLALTSA
jgi:hypothetical protein